MAIKDSETMKKFNWALESTVRLAGSLFHYQIKCSLEIALYAVCVCIYIHVRACIHHTLVWTVHALGVVVWKDTFAFELIVTLFEQNP